MVKFIKSKIQPNPNECDYWIDENADSYGSVIKTYKVDKWIAILDESAKVQELKEFVDSMYQYLSEVAFPSVVSQLETKVDKVEGKQLSTNDYTTTEKQKLAGLSNTVVVNNLTTTTTTSALSAAQGKVLKDALDALSARVSALESSAA